MGKKQSKKSIDKREIKNWVKKYRGAADCGKREDVASSLIGVDSINSGEKCSFRGSTRQKRELAR